MLAYDKDWVNAATGLLEQSWLRQMMLSALNPMPSVLAGCQQHAADVTIISVDLVCQRGPEADACTRDCQT